MRVARRSAVIAFVGVIATSSIFLVVRSDVDRLDRQRVDRPAGQALLGVQGLAGSVDRILATAQGVVATSGLDPHRFAAVLGRDVDADSTDSLAGMALVTRGAGAPRVVARVGDTHLLVDRGRAALRSPSSSTLLAFRQGRTTFELGFGASAALHGGGDAAVYLQIAMPATPGARFALVTPGAHPRVVLGSTRTVSGLVRWGQPVSFGGRSLRLLVDAEGAPSGLLGISLADLVLLVGGALTVLALAAGLLLARRDDAVRHLGDENRLLDEALDQQLVVEAELRASEERFRTILRGSPDVIVLLDISDGSCEVLNRSDLFGSPLEGVAGPDGLYSLVHPDDRHKADAHWACMRDLEPEQVCETTLRLCDGYGADRHVRLRFAPLDIGDADQPARFLGAITDVNDQIKNEAREAELEEALRRSQRLEAVGQLAGGVAHDFNNLLAAILASAELLMDHVADGRPREYAEEIQRSAVRGAALVRQLLTFAQRDRAEPRVVDLNSIVSGMEPLLRRSLGEHVQLQITTTDCSTEIVGDPTHLEQVILNLAVNARDAMPSGGVLWIATAIDFDGDAPQNDRVVLSVTDTGDGIPPDVRDRMFEPFVTTKEAGQGTGLGLSTVQSIVTGMQGHIEVLTKVGEGTTFEISFARRFGEVDSVPDGRPDEEIRGGDRRILLVEDDEAVRTALAHRLQRLDFAVTTATNGSEALQVVEQQAFDLVLTDAVMPGISGPELVGHLRRARPELSIILMSGYTPDAVPDDELVGVQRLRKPFTAPELMRALRIAFEQAMIDQAPT